MTFFAKLKKLRKNNKGASFFIVIVAMLFLTVLSTAIVYSSFTAYNVKITSKRANTAFYTVDNAMEEIKTGFQNVVSKCAKEGYEKALLVYNDPSSDVTQVFADTYRKTFYDYQYETGKNLFVLEGSGIVSGKATGKIKKEGILSFVDDALRDKVTIMNDSDPSFELVQDSEGLVNVTIKGLKVEFTDQGYTSHITTDIKLMMPQVVIYGDNSANPLDTFVMIADKGLDTAANAKDAGNPLTISGDAFFGAINITQAKPVRMLDDSNIYVGAVSRKDNNGNVIAGSQSSGKITISDFAKLYTGNGTTIWAKDIEVSEKAQFIGTDETTYTSYVNKKGSDLAGAISDLNAQVSKKPNTYYIADDLSLAEESQALITGYYYGFGDTTRAIGERLEDYSEYSSAIIFPRRTTKGTAGRALLDLNGCKELSLGGTAYVKDSDGGNEDVRMGSSIASTKEQLIYLAPASFFEKGSNPMLWEGDLDTLKNTTIPGLKDSIISTGKLSNTPLFKVNGVDKFASDYNLTTGDNLSFFSKKLNTATTQYAVYCFFKFNSTKDSNRYFKDYLSSNLGQDITKYLNDYAEIKYNANINFALDGTEFIPNESGNYSTINARGSVRNNWINDYINLSHTMTRTVSDERSTPFYYNVDADKLREVVSSGDINKLKELTGYTDITMTKKNPSDTYCLVNISQNDPKMAGMTVDIQFVISSDDLYIGSSSYSIPGVKAPTTNNTCSDPGQTLQLILCDGNVVYNGQGEGIMIMCSGAIYPDTASITLSGGNTGEGENQKPSTVLKNSGFYRNSTPTGDDNWNIDQQVVFENWKKNEG